VGARLAAVRTGWARLDHGGVSAQKHSLPASEAAPKSLVGVNGTILLVVSKAFLRHTSIAYRKDKTARPMVSEDCHKCIPIGSLSETRQSPGRGQKVRTNGKIGRRTDAEFSHYFKLYESTGDLGRERAYLRRLWTDQYSKVLNVTATELFVF